MPRKRRRLDPSAIDCSSKDRAEGTVVMSVRSLRGWRLLRSGLNLGHWDKFRQVFTSSSEVCDALVGVQAQDRQWAGFSLSVRLPEQCYTLADYKADLWRDKRLIRTWGQRGTQHAYTVRSWADTVAGLTSMGLVMNRAGRKYIPEEQFNNMVDAVEKYLKGNPDGFTSPELSDDLLTALDGGLEDGTTPTLGMPFKKSQLTLLASAKDRKQALMSCCRAIIVDLVASRRVAIHAAMLASSQSIALGEHWHADLKPPTFSIDKLEPIAKQYFAQYGPASSADLHHWLGCSSQVTSS